ncbi:MAG TPA: NUDIX domain-containing protein [Bacteroidales bacterium]|nr:NUDIX domain-containing protein [Bacteroidales bacterium]
MPKNSAGILLYRLNNQKEPEVFLVHPGGPFWAKKDKGVWSVPKGEFDAGETAQDAARREFEEETGTQVEGHFIELSPVKLKSGKIIYAFALEQDLDPATVKSNTFNMEWPPKSGLKQDFPEVDKGAWFDLDTAKEKLNKGQVPLIEDFVDKTGVK